MVVDTLMQMYSHQGASGRRHNLPRQASNEGWLEPTSLFIASHRGPCSAAGTVSTRLSGVTRLKPPPLPPPPPPPSSLSLFYRPVRLLVGCLNVRTERECILGTGSARIILRAATPRYKMQFKLSISPSHSILTWGQSVPALLTL